MKLSELALPGIPYRGDLLEVHANATPFAFSRILLKNKVLQLAISSLSANEKEIKEHISGQVESWLKAQARRAFCEKVEQQKKMHGFSYKAVSLKDTRSRWGSCSARGNLNFNWRLIMAPDGVLSYVVTHETAHLSHMNHSREFWELVAQRCPDYLQMKNWLLVNGASLMNWRLTVR
ncbi:MAG: M48 family peptidase [Erysipelotrichia bacterium]|nr:M48 family peptidase [Erysipelotrichia bacterium]